MRLIFRRPRTALDRLRSSSWQCRTCGEPHEGLFHLSAPAPAFWSAPLSQEPNGALRLDGDFLSEDFCVLGGEHFFVRAVLEIPVHGLAEAFGFGIWSTLSRKNFDTYIQGFDDGDYADRGPWPGWFSNDLEPFGETLNEACCVEPRPGRERPLITIMNSDHPLGAAQRDGITAERVLDLYAFYGHPAD